MTSAPWIIECDVGAESSPYVCKPIRERFGPFKKTNIIVGPNNSGKSRLMRSVITAGGSARKVLYDDLTCEMWELLDQIHQLLIENSNLDKGGRIGEVFSSIRRLQIPVHGQSIDSRQMEKLLREIQYSSGDPPCVEELYKLSREFIARMQRFARPKDRNRIKQIYVPSLRSFKSPESDSKYFSNVARKHYFEGVSASDLAVECGGDMYDRLKVRLLGNRQERASIRLFEEFISRHFLEGKGLTLIPREREKMVFARISNETEQSIPNIGDGIQQIVTILFSAFTEQEPCLLFIEEPELFLHPGFQTRLLQCFEKQELAHVQVFATTHSNHLLNLTIDRANTAIFQVRKECPPDHDEAIPSFTVERLTGERREVLAELGVARSSLLLSNCSILVEGPTDRRYFQRFLEIYIAENKGTDGFTEYTPDLHYSFVEYGGANIVQWGFLERENAMDFTRILGAEVFVIIDQDESKWKEERYKELQESLGNRVYRIGAIEVENLLGVAALRSVVAEYERGEVESLRDISEAEYANKRLGTFLEEKIASSKRRSSNNHPYADVPKSGNGGGTLKRKVDFCDRAIPYINTRSDLTQAAWELAEKIYDFIKKHN